MKSDVQNLSDTRVKLTVELSFDELAEQVDAAYKRISTQVQIPGFRKGKVPRPIIDQRVGRGAVLEEVVNAAVPPAYDSAIQEAGVHALGQPEVEVTDIVDGERISFTAEVDVRPDFELPQYKELTTEVGTLAVTDDDVDEQVAALAARFGSYTEVDRPTQEGDVLLIDMAAVSGDEAIDELTARGLSFEVGEEGLVPGADEAVVGLSAGQSTTVDFVPEFGSYAGRNVSVTITVNAVREKVLPEIDDELAMMASEFDTLEELRADLRTRLERVRLMERGREAQQQLHDQLLDSLDIPLPDGLIAAEVQSHFEEHEDSDDDHRRQVEEDARKALKSQFLMDRIADAENISVGEAELSRWLVAQAPRYGMSADQFAQALVEAGQVPMAVNEVRRGKALALVLETAQIRDDEGNPVDLQQLQVAAAADALAAMAEDTLEDEDLEDEDVEDDEAVPADQSSDDTSDDTSADSSDEDEPSQPETSPDGATGDEQPAAPTS